MKNQRQESQYARSLIEASLDPLVTISTEGTITAANEAPVTVTGVNRAQLIGNDFSQYFTQPEQARAGYMLALARDEQEAIIGYLLIGTDNTARKLEEEARHRVQKELADKQQQLEELNRELDIRVAKRVDESRKKGRMMIVQSRQTGMGEMIDNIAHQWRQPLATLGMVLANIKAAHESNELDAMTMELAIDTGNQLVQKMSTTINDFSNFFRPNQESLPFSAQEQISAAIALVESGFSSHNISIDYEKNTDFTLAGFPNEYSQVLLNLLSNAKAAIVSSGAAEGRVTIALESRNGCGCIILSDNGGGIPVESVDRIFEPYFSTKPLGTGIGLYMSKMIVEQSMKGSIVAKNIAGGSEFTISVPLAHATP